MPFHSSYVHVWGLLICRKDGDEFAHAGAEMATHGWHRYKYTHLFYARESRARERRHTPCFPKDNEKSASLWFLKCQGNLLRLHSGLYVIFPGRGGALGVRPARRVGGFAARAGAAQEAPSQDGQGRSCPADEESGSKFKSGRRGEGGKKTTN